MSNEVDKRVVQMEFDNKRFEKNVRQTRKSLDELDQSLQFKDASKGIDEVKVKLSALQVVATTFVANISNKIINLGTILVKSLSVNNIFAGWQKYGDKTISVATLLAQKIKIAGKEITDQAEKLEKVNEQLELLNWFSDETSYSFNDMVSNVGKFTAAGQDLDISVKAMQGIATWAALSGQNATKASQAMYQLAQALGAGSVKLMDWKSIQNYNMDTEEFRATVLDTAVALGQLTKAGDEFVTKTGKKFTQSQFTSYLSEGWFSSDVLLKSLEKYSAAVEEIYDISEREGITASEVIEKYGNQLDQFGVKAFKAAQEARTFSDAIASVKDAVSSKWMTTFETVFGGNEGSIKFWTDLANSLYDTFAAAGDFRNEVLAVWSSLKGNADLFAKGGENQGVFWNIYDALGAIKKTITSAWNTIFPLSVMQEYSDKAADVGNKLKSLTERFRVFTQGLILSADNSRRLTELFKGLFTVVKIGINVLKALRFAIDPIIELGKELIGQILDRIIYYGSKFVDITGFIQKAAMNLQQVLLNLIDILDLPSRVDQIFDFMEEIFSLVKQYKLFDKVKNIFESFFKAFRENGGTTENMTKILKGLVSIIGVLGKVVVATAGAILSVAGPVLEALGMAFGQIAGYIAGIMVDIVAKAGDMFTALDKKLNSSSFVDFGTKLKEFLISIIKLFEKLAPLLALIGNLIKKLVDVILMIPKMLDDISIRLTGRGIIDNLSYAFNTILGVFESFGEKREQISNELQSQNKGMARRAISPGEKDSSGMESALTPFQIFVQGVTDFVKGAGKILLALVAVVGKALSILGGILDTVGQFFIDLASGQKELETWQKVLMWIGGILLAILIPLAVITNAIKNFVWQLQSTFLPLSTLADSVSGYFDGKRLEAIGRMIEEVANSILKVSIAILLLIQAGQSLSRTAKGVLAIVVIIGALTATIILLHKYLNDFNNQITHLAQPAKGIRQSISECIQNFGQWNQMQALAGVIWSFGNLMIKLAFAFILFDKVSPEGMQKGINIAMGLMLGLALMSITANKNLAGIDYRKLMPSLTQMLGFAFLLKTVAKTLIQLSTETNPDAMWTAVLSLVSVLGMVMFALLFANKYATNLESGAKELKKSNKQTKKVISNMKGLIGSMAVLVLSFALATKILSSIKSDDMWRAAAAVYTFIGIFTAMSSVLMVLSKFRGTKPNQVAAIMESMNKFASGLIKVALVMLILSRISLNDNSKNFFIALLSFIAGMTALSIAMANLQNVKPKAIENFTKAMQQFAINLMLFGLAMLAVGSLSWEKITKASFVIGIALTSMASMMLIALGMKKVSRGTALEKTFKTLIASMAALAGFALIMTYLAKMDWEQIGKSAAVMAVALGSIAGLVAIMAIMKSAKIDTTSIISMAGALIIFSASLIIFAGALTLIGAIGLPNLITGIIGVAAALLTLFVLSKMAAPSIKTMIALAAALALIGVALLMAGIGLQAMTNAMTGLGEDAETLLPRILEVITGIATGLIDVLLDSISKVAETIIENAPVIGEMIKTLVLTALDVLNSTAPQIIETVINLLDVLLSNLASHSESIANAIVTIIANALAALDSRFSEICNHIFSMLHQLLVVFNSWIPSLVKDLVRIIITLLEALVTELGPKIPYILKLIVTLIGQVLEGLVKVVVPLAGLLTKVMLIMISVAIRLLIVSLGALSQLFLELVTSIILILVHTFIGLGDVIFEAIRTVLYNVIYIMNKVLAEVGKLIPTLLVSGFSAFIGGILQGFVNILDSFNLGWVADLLGIRGAAKSMMSVTDSLLDEVVRSGKNVMNAVDSASRNIQNVVSWSGDAVNNTLTNAFTEINKTTDTALTQMDGAMGDFGSQIGMNFGNGMAEGILGSKDTVDGAANDLAKSGVDEIVEELDIHSPSRVMMNIGGYVADGLAIGIQNGSSKVEDNMHNMVDKTMEIASSIVNEQNGDDITLKVGLDISSVEDQTQRIQEIMSGIDDPNMSYYGRNADYASRKLSRSDEPSHVVNEDKSTTVNYTNTFNISSTDPQESAEEIDKVLHDQALKAKFAHGS